MRNKKRWRTIRSFIIGWTLGFAFMSIVRGVGTTEMGSVDFELDRSLIVSVIFGAIFGSISGCAQIFMEERVYKRTSLRRLLVLRFTYAILFLFTLILISYAMVTTLFGVEIDLLTFIVEPGSFAIYFYILTLDIFLVVLRQVNLMLGENNLWKLLQGKFYTPTEEDRIFMFLDLQSSTSIAEKLGHTRYSMLIQDCFDDLGVVANNDAEIYQYVGDEVILTWRLRDGLLNGNCLNAFYNFKERLITKNEYYLENYHCKPVFKAGIHEGMVSVTEVGKFKKEIAYHGDTINTAARIQGKCNDFKKELLVSDRLRRHFDNGDFRFEKLGDISLRGKKDEVDIYTVSRLGESAS